MMVPPSWRLSCVRGMLSLSLSLSIYAHGDGDRNRDRFADHSGTLAYQNISTKLECSMMMTHLYVPLFDVMGCCAIRNATSSLEFLLDQGGTVTGCVGCEHNQLSSLLFTSMHQCIDARSHVMACYYHPVIMILERVATNYRSSYRGLSSR
uniref:Putative secreted protein n=1 Tax=Anopheles marajoara TaxID=58244 RepID=A0A2M4C6C3_9DIPT